MPAILGGGGLLSAIASNAAAERERWPLWLPAGAWLLESLSISRFRLSLTLAFGIGLSLAGLLLGVAAALSPEAWLRAVLAGLASVLIGFGAAKARTEMLSAPVLMHRLGPLTLEGRVDEAQAHGKGIRATFTLISADRMHGAAVPYRVRVYFRKGGEMLAPGEIARFKAVLLPPPAPSSPGDYDFGRAAYYLRLGGVGYAYGEPQITTADAPETISQRIAVAVEKLRHRMTARDLTMCCRAARVPSPPR